MTLVLSHSCRPKEEEDKSEFAVKIGAKCMKSPRQLQFSLAAQNRNFMKSIQNIAEEIIIAYFSENTVQSKNWHKYLKLYKGPASRKETNGFRTSCTFKVDQSI